jgi:hypothetical protein
MLDKNLAPCPYCNSRRLHLVLASFTHKVVCEQCRCSGPQRRTTDDAMAEWNQVSQRVWDFAGPEIAMPRQVSAARH